MQKNEAETARIRFGRCQQTLSQIHAKSGELDLNLRKVLHVLDNNVITYADQTVN